MSERWDTLLIDCRLATLADTGTPYGAIERARSAARTAARLRRTDERPARPARCARRSRRIRRQRAGSRRAWSTATRTSSSAAIARTNSSCASKARATRRSRAPAAASCRPCARRARPTRTRCSRSRCRARARWSADGVDDDRDQVRLRPRSRQRAQDAARRAPHRRDARHQRPHDVARRACVAAGVQGSRRRLHRRDLRRDACPRSRAKGWSMRSMRSASASPSRPRRRGACSTTARALGLPVKLHADQLSDLGGAALAAEFGALLGRPPRAHQRSTACARWPRTARSRCCCRAPSTCCAKRKLPPIDAFRAHGVPMAIATDCNPGTSPLLSLRLAMSMACTLFRLTPEEALRGATVHAARALGFRRPRHARVGKRADFVVWNIERPAELCYWIGGARSRGASSPAGASSRAHRKSRSETPWIRPMVHRSDDRGVSSVRAAMRSARRAVAARQCLQDQPARFAAVFLTGTTFFTAGLGGRLRRGAGFAGGRFLRRVRARVAVAADRDLALARLAVASAHRRFLCKCRQSGAEDSSPRRGARSRAPCEPRADQRGVCGSRFPRSSRCRAARSRARR